MKVIYKPIKENILAVSKDSKLEIENARKLCDYFDDPVWELFNPNMGFASKLDFSYDYFGEYREEVKLYLLYKQYVHYSAQYIQAMYGWLKQLFMYTKGLTKVNSRTIARIAGNDHHKAEFIYEFLLFLKFNNQDVLTVLKKVKIKEYGPRAVVSYVSLYTLDTIICRFYK